MPAATVDSSAEDGGASSQDRIRTESLPQIDLRLLTQPELLSLSLCSSSSPSHLRNDTDISTTKIDSSVFNESAGSRKQTFSRLRLAPPRNYQFLPPNQNPHHHYQHQHPHHLQEDLQGHYVEEGNIQILSLISSLFGGNSRTNSYDEEEDDNNNYNNLVSVPVSYSESSYLVSNYDSGEQNVPVEVSDLMSVGSSKRKRGRPRKNESCFYQFSNVSSSNGSSQVIASKNENEEGNGNVGDVPVEVANIMRVGSSKRKPGRPRKSENYVCQISNASGNERKQLIARSNENENAVVVDLVGGVEEDPYGQELRRRTVGMRSEVELLGFLERTEGEWVSARKKRKIVDAGAFGDVLPNGWKLMLCLRRRAGDMWLGNRRYIRFFDYLVLCIF